MSISLSVLVRPMIFGFWRLGPTVPPCRGSQADGIAGVYLAIGHSPTGLTLGPYGGKLAAEQALGGVIEWDLTPFSAAHFDALPRSSSDSSALEKL